ncbi:hypothetical protein ABUW04_23310 [Streptacidiphilus sp. N1-10]|uniref:Uncharacterized protein n=1 Tax=Streptacidiphilus jeojiensis TaxID=3229225 RepID=A0ABV6XT01_9ACTN
MGSVNPVVQLVVPVVLLVVLVLLLRWTWTPRRGRSLVARTARRGAPGEYGLLVPVAAPADAAESLRLTAVLEAAGIRCTVVDTTQGTRLMVWPESAAGARRVLRELQKGGGGSAEF